MASFVTRPAKFVGRRTGLLACTYGATPGRDPLIVHVAPFRPRAARTQGAAHGLRIRGYLVLYQKGPLQT